MEKGEIERGTREKGKIEVRNGMKRKRRRKKLRRKNGKEGVIGG